MRIVAVRSIKGGSGATSTAANLGAALQAEGVPVLMIDLCPTNMLRLHFGMNWQDDNGLVKQITHDKPWYDAAYQSETGINFVPYGKISSDKERTRLPTLFIKDPDWLSKSLAQLDLDPACWIIIDCPSSNTYISEAVSSHAQHTLLVMTADPACYASLQDFPVDADNSHCLVNRFNPLMALERDIYDLLQADYQRLMLPLNIHRDESIREALAYKQTVFPCAPHSQAAHDYTTLATWLRAHDKQEPQKPMVISDE